MVSSFLHSLITTAGIWLLALVFASGCYFGAARICADCRRNPRGDLRLVPWWRYLQAAFFAPLYGLAVAVLVLVSTRIVVMVYVVAGWSLGWFPLR